MGFTIRGGRVVEIDALADLERLRELNLRTVLGAGIVPADDAYDHR